MSAERISLTGSSGTLGQHLIQLIEVESDSALLTREGEGMPAQNLRQIHGPSASCPATALDIELARSCQITIQKPSSRLKQASK